MKKNHAKKVRKLYGNSPSITLTDQEPPPSFARSAKENDEVE